MKTYKGLFIRSFMGDKNEYPKAQNAPIWASPDIIPYGTNVCSDPRKEFLGGNFNKEFPRDVIGGIQNYVYVRGENKSGASLDGRMYLYWSDATMLLAPSTWKQIKSTQEKDYVQFKAAANEKIVCSSDDDGIFSFKPEKTETHPCLISRIVTKDYPAPIPDLSTIDHFAIFVRSEQGMGYASRNLRYIDATAPSYTLTERLVNPFPDSIEDAYVILNLYAVPVGTDIQMTCKGSREGCNLEIKRRTITEDSYSKPVSLAVWITNMPSGFSYPLCVHFWSNGKPITGAFKIEIDFVALFNEKSEAYAFGSPMNELGTADFYEDGKLLGRALHAERLEEGGLRQFVRVGSCAYTHITTIK